MNMRIPALAGLLLIFGNASAADLFIDADIDRHARAWIRHIDGGDPGTAWDASSDLMKAGTAKADWEKAVKPLSVFGKVKSRTPTSIVFAVKMPGMPDGQYAIINYDTAFSGKEKTVESVILRRETDGLWLGVGYRVQ